MDTITSPTTSNMSPEADSLEVDLFEFVEESKDLNSEIKGFKLQWQYPPRGSFLRCHSAEPYTALTGLRHSGQGLPTYFGNDMIIRRPLIVYLMSK